MFDGFDVEQLGAGVIGTWRENEFSGGHQFGGNLIQTRLVQSGDPMPRDDEQERSHGNGHVDWLY
jgi:hypothetical protein